MWEKQNPLRTEDRPTIVKRGTTCNGNLLYEFYNLFYQWSMHTINFFCVLVIVLMCGMKRHYTSREPVTLEYV